MEEDLIIDVDDSGNNEITNISEYYGNYSFFDQQAVEDSFNYSLKENKQFKEISNIIFENSIEGSKKESKIIEYVFKEELNLYKLVDKQNVEEKTLVEFYIWIFLSLLGLVMMYQFLIKKFKI